MKEINIAKTIVRKRKEKGVTQDELASYIGVSKASVSKWETGLSYPDITFLPQLATYFNISIDELIGYSPQMTKEDIKKLYFKLAADFYELPFDNVMQHCQDIIKKYYSCFPLLAQMSILILNHLHLSESVEKQTVIGTQIKDLCVRIKEESGDVSLIKQANFLEALCEINLGNPNSAKELLGDVNDPLFGEEVLLSTAYYLTGELDKAKETTQIGILRHLLGIIGDLPNYLMLHTDDAKKFEEIVTRAFGLSQIFLLDELHPIMMVTVYLSAAQGYVMLGNIDQCFKLLERYTAIYIRGMEQFTFHGDDFFDRVDSWFEQLELGKNPPRDKKALEKSIIDGVVKNPCFEPLREDIRYKRIVQMLTKIKVEKGD